MKELFKKLKGLNVEEGAKLIRSIFNVTEQSHIDGEIIDFDFYVEDNKESYFHFTTKVTKVYGDEDIIDYDNGYWGLMLDGNHYTHVE